MSESRAWFVACAMVIMSEAIDCAERVESADDEISSLQSATSRAPSRARYEAEETAGDLPSVPSTNWGKRRASRTCCPPRAERKASAWLKTRWFRASLPFGL